jgi:hypothetical protein
MAAMCNFRTNAVAARSSLSNHYIGYRKQRRRDSQIECLGGLEIDHWFPSWSVLEPEDRLLLAIS